MGGEIGKMADRCYVQRRVLNRSKGPAVWALRAQTDKHEYARNMRTVLEEQPNLEIREGMVVDVQVGLAGWVQGLAAMPLLAAGGSTHAVPLWCN
jgi:tRNA uridine 5-carboxymethylaminomethyl modification enzyme